MLFNKENNKMKLKNIFKKKSNIIAKANIQSLDKKQLEKVIGGTEATGGKTGMPLKGGISGTTA